MTAPQIVQEIEAAGGVLTLNGDRILYDVPKRARSLVDVLREHRDEVFRVLRERTCYPHGRRDYLVGALRRFASARQN